MAAETVPADFSGANILNISTINIPDEPVQEVGISLFSAGETSNDMLTRMAAEVAADEGYTDITSSLVGSVDGSVRLLEKNSPVPAGNDTVQYILLWTGRVNGLPVLGEEIGKDIADVRFEIWPQGGPAAVCSYDSDTDTWSHGTDYTAPKHYPVHAYLTINYRQVDVNGNPLFLLLAGGVSSEGLKTLRTNLLDDTLCALLRETDLEKFILDTNAGDPVYMVDGSYHSSYTDLRLESGIPMSFDRIYNSRYMGGSLGQGFTHSYEYSLEEDAGIFTLMMPGSEYCRAS